MSYDQLLEAAEKNLPEGEKRAIRGIYNYDLMKTDLVNLADEVFINEEDILVSVSTMKKELELKIQSEMKSIYKSGVTSDLCTSQLSLYIEMNNNLDSFAYFLNAIGRIRKERDRRVEVYELNYDPENKRSTSQSHVN